MKPGNNNAPKKDKNAHNNNNSSERIYYDFKKMKENEMVFQNRSAPSQTITRPSDIFKVTREPKTTPNLKLGDDFNNSNSFPGKKPGK